MTVFRTNLVLGTVVQGVLIKLVFDLVQMSVLVTVRFQTLCFSDSFNIRPTCTGFFFNQFP